MTKYKMIARRSAALALAGAMVCGCALGAGAASSPAVKRDETVFVTLASDGTVQKTTDSIWLHADDGLNGYTEDTGLSDITMLKDTEQPTQDGSRLSFSTSDIDAYYQGTADESLPVSVQITYTLDGTQMTAEELAGQSGHLVMHFAFTNNEYTEKEIDGKTRKVYTPFATIVAATLDTDTFQDVKADDGAIQTDSSKDMVGFLCLPGMKETYGDLLTGNFAELADYLHDDVTIEADVTDFEMPMLYIASATDASKLEQTDELNDYTDLFGDMDKLTDAMNELIDGGKQLLTGTTTLNSGAGDLYNGIQTLDNGAADLQTGAHTAANGAATLSSGLNTLSGNSQSLRDGAYQTFQQLCSTAQDQINAKLTAAGMSTIALTPETYGDVLQGLVDSLGSVAYQSALQQVTAGVDQDLPSVYDQYVAGDANLSSMAYQGAAKQGIMQQYSMTEETFQAWIGVPANQATFQAVVGNLTDAQKKSARDAVVAQMTDEQKAAVRQGAIDQVMSSASVQAQITAGQTAADAQAAAIAAVKGQLSQYNTFYTGVLQYTAGVDSASSGASQLASGTSQLANGTDTLKSGADQLLSGAATLKNGTSTLQGGVQDMYDGLVKFNTEGISKLTSSEDIDNLQTLMDITDEVKAARESYTSFAGSAEDTTGSVKFVMKVSAQKQQTQQASSVVADTTAAPAANGNFFSNLWKRITALFHN